MNEQQNDQPRGHNDVLLPYQIRWLADESPIKVAEKSRRIGLTWTEAAASTLAAAASKGMDTWYPATIATWRSSLPRPPRYGRATRQGGEGDRGDRDRHAEKGATCSPAHSLQLGSQDRCTVVATVKSARQQGPRGNRRLSTTTSRGCSRRRWPLRCGADVSA